jgi:hypothetical protein
MTNIQLQVSAICRTDEASNDINHVYYIYKHCTDYFPVEQKTCNLNPVLQV